MQIQRFVQDALPIVTPIIKASAKWGAGGFVVFSLAEFIKDNRQYSTALHSGLLCAMTAFYTRATVSILYPSFGKVGATIGAIAVCGYSMINNENAVAYNLELTQRWKATTTTNLPFLASCALVALKHRNLLQTYFQG